MLRRNAGRVRYEQVAPARPPADGPGRRPPGRSLAQRVPGGEHDDGHLTVTDLDRERIHRKPVLGGLINEYARAA